MAKSKQDSSKIPLSEKKITKEDCIGDVLRQYPDVIEVFLDFGIHCVGCAVSEYETIEQGILSHGFSEEDLEEFLEHVNEVIHDPNTFTEGNREDR